VGGFVRWRRYEAAIAADRPLPASRLAPGVLAAFGTVVVCVAVLVGVEVAGR
jgi:putative membrane protein